MRLLASRFTLLALLLVALGADPLGAQGTTTGAIRGRVTDEGDQPLVGAQVSATNEATGLVRAAQTDDQGVFTIRLLPPGGYTVTVRRLGQQPAEQRGVRVIVGSTTPANFALRTAAVTLSAVQVTAGAAPVDVTDAGVRTTVTEEQIANLPTLGRDFTDFINLSGRVSPSPETTTGGQFSIAGQRPSQTNIQIDGVDANNAFFGENRGSSRIPFNFSLESVKEFQVIANGYDVEYGNYTGGIVNIVTRGGTNDFEAAVYANYRGDNLTADDFAGNPPRNFEAQQFAGKVEGPIRRDKLFYLFSFDGQRRREPFRSLSPALLRDASGKTASRAAQDSATALLMESFFTTLDTAYGQTNAGDTYGEWEVTNDVITLFGRLDWNLNEAHRLSVRNNFSAYENKNESGSFLFASGRTQAETINDVNNSLVSELNSTLRPNLFNVLRLQYSFERRPRDPNNKLPELRVVLNSAQTVEYGGAFISFNNDLDETKFQIVDNLTLDLGRHTLKLGTNNTFSRFDNKFWLNGSGAYEFNSLADFAARLPSRYNRNVRSDGLPPTAEFAAQEYSVYAQDDWQVTPKLLASLGVRYDVARYGDRPGRVIDVERALGFRTGTAPIDNDNVAPRVQLTYDVAGDATQVVRIGAGLFYGRVPYVMGSNVAITEVPLRVLDCRGSILEGAADAPPIPDFGSWSPSGSDNPFNCAGGAGIGGVPEYAFWSDDFEIPETVKANVGYERQLGRATRLKLDADFSESSKLYTVRNMNLRDPLFELAGEGNRRIFVPEGSFNPSSAAGAERLRNTDFANLYVNYNDGVARSTSASIELQHQLRDSSQISGSYTWTRAYDNSSFSCCTSNEGFRNQRAGVLGPNIIGGIGDESAVWGPSEYERRHTIVFSGFTRLPFGIQLSGIWRLQSGEPWGPEIEGDLNGDGERFNDRPYIFRPAELPVYVAPSVTDPMVRDSIIGVHRGRYASFLDEHECIGDYQGQVIPRNTCRQPWFSSVDLSFRKHLPTAGGQRVSLQLDLFNVLNGLNRDWGRNLEVTTSARNLLRPEAYDAASDEIQYTVPPAFGERRIVGSNLIQQFSAQVGVRYSF